MEIEKIRNLTGPELVQQEKDLMDQLFRLKFQMKMGQTESLNRVRGLRKDIARTKTIARQREMQGPGVGENDAAKPIGKAVAQPALAKASVAKASVATPAVAKAAAKKAPAKKAVYKKAVKKLEKK